MIEMTRTCRQYLGMDKVALLTTGDEVINGDIINSNAQNIAQLLFTAGIPVGYHMSVHDDIETIERAIAYLAESHRAVVITGGLGPTRDDITRNALSAYLDQPLVVDDSTLNQLENYFQHVGTPFTDNNRQQALFPQESVVIPNPRGTAAGCMAMNGEKYFFMLPGPPNENIPMVKSAVLPELASMRDSRVYKKWLVFGISESILANLIDDTLLRYSSHIGYRFAYPYIEVKGFFANEQDIQSLELELNELLKTHDRVLLEEVASERLAKLAETIAPIKITDYATGGELEQRVLTPNNHHRLIFHDQHQETNMAFTLAGLEAYWEQQEATTTSVTVEGPQGQKSYEFRYYGRRVLAYAAEVACFHILKTLGLE